MTSTDIDATEAINDLQIELQSAKSLVDEIKSENEQLRQQVEAANAFSRANQQRHTEWKAAWKVEREVLSTREKQLEKDEIKWMARLDDLRKELEELEGRKLWNIEGSKCHGEKGLNLLKDVEAEHAIKTEALLNEANKWRDQYHASRKIYEELHAQHEQLQGRSNRERIVAESIQKEISSLQHALAEQIERSDHHCTVSTEVIARDLKYQLAEKELHLEKLHQEVKSMQKIKDDALSAKDELVASHHAELTNMMQDIANYKANNLVLERRIQDAAKDVAQAVATKSELEECTKSASKELAFLQKSMASKEERYKQELDRLGKALSQSESRMKVQLASVNNLLNEEQSKCKELESRCLDTQEFAMKQISDLAKDLKQADDSKEQLLFAKDQITKQENSIVELQRELAHAHLNHQNEVQRLQHACEACHKDLNLVLFEKKELDKISVADKIQLAQIQQQREESETSIQKLENKYQSVVDEKDNLLGRLDELTGETKSLRNMLKSMSEEVRVLKDSEANERKKTEGALKIEVGKVRQELEKEKRRSNAYKSKALESHRRSIQAKEVLDSICS